MLNSLREYTVEPRLSKIDGKMTNLDNPDKYIV